MQSAFIYFFAQTVGESSQLHSFLQLARVCAMAPKHTIAHPATEDDLGW